ncbi:MAG: hypothetical protein F6K11_17330 [Leptolyngbya sp. SIO3F4]|nr:hypothetical protein [Leptolyngbya sp. SIO3F4]
MVSTSKPQPLRSVGLPDIDQILGVATFDAVGLPCDSFITPQHKETEWVQLVFQLLGLQQLIAFSMDLSSIGHTMIRAKIGNIVVVKYEFGYIAVLLKRSLPQERPHVDNDWVGWLCDLEATVVRNHANFKAV